MTTNIEWRTVSIENYPDLYEVSSTGLVRSLDWRCTGETRELNGRIFQGYRAINFKRRGLKQRTIAVHKLVAEAFFGPCPVGYEVDHIDRNRLNNHVSNLRYITHKENCNNKNPRLPKTAK